MDNKILQELKKVNPVLLKIAAIIVSKPAGPVHYPSGPAVQTQGSSK